MELLFWVLFTYGVCNILIFGSNFEWLRDFLKLFGTGGYSLHKLFTCMVCLPTWVGIFMGFIGRNYLNLSTPSLMYGVDNIWFGILFDGIVTSACVWLVHTFQEAMERHGSND